MESHNNNRKKLIIKIIIFSVVFILATVGLFFLFKFLGITDVNKLQEIIRSCGAWGWVVFLLLQVLCTVLLSTIPGTSMTFITVGVILFGANWKTFLLCFSGVIIASIVMDLIGRFGGNRIIVKLIGQERYDETYKLIQTKGMIYIPFFYLLPLFPDDFICMICGSLKVKFWVHLIEIFLCRGIGCATIVFGVSLLPVDLVDNLKLFNWSFIFAHLWDYLTLITVLLFWVLLLLFIARKLDTILTNYIKKHSSDNGEKKE